ncbi:MAG: tyrosine-type recombinase/integrase, partial [Candidatus Saccharimonadales bacterium]
EKNVTFHVARHTFADLLKKYQSEKGKSDIYLIQEALGHSDVKTTETYLGSLGNDEVNTQVNEMFAEKLLQGSSKIAS